jgi:flagellar basal-body rod modification protein FlgD
MTAAIAPAATAAASTAGKASASALNTLGNNYTNFLTLLTTQLKNQNPSSPLDTNQFTSELVQFSSVEQQINTNSNLTQLIQLTQASQVEQSSAMIGKPVTVTSTQLSLQKGAAAVNFNTTAAGQVNVAVYNASGAVVQNANLDATLGSNTWKWDGKDVNGILLPDGPYKVGVTSVAANGKTAPLSFTVTGTTTSVQNNAGTVQLQMGGLTVPFSSVQSVGG